MFKNKIILIIVIFLLIISSFHDVTSAPIMIYKFQIKATINDKWIDGNFTKMEIEIIEVHQNITPLPEGKSAESFGIIEGKTYEITIFFDDENGSGHPQEIPGSPKYKISDEIEGCIYKVGDEYWTGYYMHTSPKKYENITLENDNITQDKNNNTNLNKESYPLYLFIIIFTITIITLAITYYIKRKSKQKET